MSIMSLWRKIKSNVRNSFGRCDHSWYVDESFEAVFHYGSIGEVIAIDSQKTCPKCEMVIRERMFTSQYAPKESTTIKPGVKKDKRK